MGTLTEAQCPRPAHRLLLEGQLSSFTYLEPLITDETGRSHPFSLGTVQDYCGAPQNNRQGLAQRALPHNTDHASAILRSVPGDQKRSI